RPGRNKAEAAIDEVDHHRESWPVDRAWGGGELTTCLPCPSSVLRRPHEPSPRQGEPMGRKDEINRDQGRHRPNPPPASPAVARPANLTNRSDEVTEIARRKCNERAFGDKVSQPDCFTPVD